MKEDEEEEGEEESRKKGDKMVLGAARCHYGRW